MILVVLFIQIPISFAEDDTNEVFYFSNHREQDVNDGSGKKIGYYENIIYNLEKENNIGSLENEDDTSKLSKDDAGQKKATEIKEKLEKAYTWYQNGITQSNICKKMVGNDGNTAIRTDQTIAKSRYMDRISKAIGLLKKASQGIGLNGKKQKEQENYGILLEPIGFLVRGTGDALIGIMQKYMYAGSPKAVEKRVKEDITQADVDLFINNNFLNDIGSIDELAGSGRVSKYPIPRIYYSPATIFSNLIPALDINFIKPSVKNRFLNDDDISKLENNGYNENEIENIKKLKQEQDTNGVSSENSAYALQKVVAKWYFALRNLSAIGLMVVLVYVGIRILISSVAEEKAKYKEMLKNWFMALIFLFTIHYVMLFLLELVNVIINILNSVVVDGTGQDSLMNNIRVLAQNDYSVGSSFGYTVMYFVLVIYTITFTWQYIKRVIYIAFLTLIAPLVTLTYPIDKISDNRSQAFDIWFKEYIYNLLIQPIHLLLYLILVSSAMELAKSNILYAIIAIGFIRQAENFIKTLFGIQGEGGALSGSFAAGAMFSTALSGMKTVSSKISKGLPSGGKGGEKSDKKDSSSGAAAGPASSGINARAQSFLNSRDGSNNGENTGRFNKQSK